MAIEKSVTMKWETTGVATYIGIPICPGSYFNSNDLKLRVDWGDGDVTNITEPNSTGSFTSMHLMVHILFGYMVVMAQVTTIES